MPLQLSWLEHLTLNQGVLGSSPRRGTMGWTVKAQVHKTSKRREHRRTQTGVWIFYGSQSDLKQETPLNLEYSIYLCPRSSDGIEHRISNPLARGSSPFGDTIYGFSSMERVSGYEPLDRGSTPLIRTSCKGNMLLWLIQTQSESRDNRTSQVPDSCWGGRWHPAQKYLRGLSVLYEPAHERKGQLKD